MQNRANLSWQDDPSPDNGWDTDRSPGLRLSLLFAGLVVALATIGTRLAWVQGSLTEEYAAAFEQTETRLESIASSDGRILAAGGEILAQDVPVLGLQVHYRWIEEPPNPAWLKQQAFAALERGERRKPELVRAEVERVLERREKLWQRLAESTGVSIAQLNKTRGDIQKRVEKIRASAERRRTERENEAQAAARPELPADAPLWQQAWHTVKETLTTPPRREEVEPLVMQEERSYHPLIEELPLEIATAIETRNQQYPGTRISAGTRRVYPLSHVAPHLVGFRKADDKALESRQQRFPEGDPLDYQAGDRIGLTGVEKTYDHLIRGLRGQRQLTLNRRGEVIKTEVLREPRVGQDVTLSVNLNLQQMAEGLLDELLTTPAVDPITKEPLPIPRGGCLLAIDVRTGGILASASGPRFDLNLYAPENQELLRQTLADPRSPFIDRATRVPMPPGSVFKALTAVAFLESGQIDPEQAFHCQGFLDRPDQFRCQIFRRFKTGHNEVRLVDALAKSCNVYFFSGARRVGGGPIVDWAGRFGFGQRTGVDLPDERAGNLPAAPTSRHGSGLGETLLLSIGQARLTVTPLQIARMMAAISNGGKLVTPHIVEKRGLSVIEDNDDATTGMSMPTDATPIAGLSQRTLSWVQHGLQQVVAHPQGTAYKTVRMSEVAIAGKTGTAETGGNRPDHAWFAGYAPAGKPRVAFVVVLEHAGSGGHVAGPLARKFVQAMLQEGLLGEVRNTTASNGKAQMTNDK